MDDECIATVTPKYLASIDDFTLYPTLSLSDKRIIVAVLEGYYADTAGNVFNPSGKLLRGSPKPDSGHLSITFKRALSERPIPVLLHRFVAYYFLGVDALLKQCIRHRNDSPIDNRIDNLVPGTKAENRADIPRAKLSAIAKLLAPKLVARSRKLSDDDIRSMRIDYAYLGVSYATLAKKYSVSTMTAYRAVTKQSWSNVV